MTSKLLMTTVAAAALFAGGALAQDSGSGDASTTLQPPGGTAVLGPQATAAQQDVGDGNLDDTETGTAMSTDTADTTSAETTSADTTSAGDTGSMGAGSMDTGSMDTAQTGGTTTDSDLTEPGKAGLDLDATGVDTDMKAGTGSDTATGDTMGDTMGTASDSATGDTMGATAAVAPPMYEGEPLTRQQVKALQEALAEQGRDVTTDGLWGPNTRQALIGFQEAEGIEATGELTEETVAALGVDLDAEVGMGGAGMEAESSGDAASGGDISPLGIEENPSEAQLDPQESDDATPPVRDLSTMSGGGGGQ